MKRFMARELIVFFAMVVATGFVTSASQKESGDKSASGAAEGSQEQKTAAPKADSTYIIGSNDVLDINVWKENEISRTVPVRPDGMISLPLLNDVEAAGLTPMQLQSAVTQRLKKFISDPQVTVIVKEVNSRRVYVLGEVLRPGGFAMLPNMTVLQAVSMAGGFSQYAKMSGIYVLRTDNGHQVTFPFNYKEVIRGKGADQNIILKPGDTIVVP